MAAFADILSDRGLPASVQAERTILGAMMLDAVAFNDATSKLTADDFSLDSHRRIYSCITGLVDVGRAVDVMTIIDELDRRKELQAIGDRPYLYSLSEDLPHRLNVEEYVRIVKNKSLLRQVMTVCQTAMTLAADQTEEAISVLDTVQQQMSEISEKGTPRGFAGIQEIVANSFGSIDALYEQGREITGLATHYIEFDRMTSGLQDSELIIIAARPSMGKTAWAINIAQNAAVRDGKVVAVFSLEMSKESLLRRMLASEAMVNSRKIQTGFLPREDKGKLLAGLERLMESKLFIDDTPGITLAEMRAKARQLQQREGRLDLIVIDYLQLMTGPSAPGKRGFENRNQEVSAVSRGLKALAKELRLPVIALSQLSRASEQRGGDKKPMLSDLRESGSIEQDADVVAFIHRESYYNKTEDGEEDPETKGKADIIIAKQRNGPTGTVHLAYLSDYTRFENLAPAGAEY